MIARPFVLGPVTALLLATSPLAAADSGAAALDALAAEAWEHHLAESPATRIARGLPVETLPDFSFEHAQAEAAWARGLEDRLRAVDPAALDHERWLTREILLWQAGHTAEAAEHFWPRFQVTPYTWSFSGVSQTFAGLPLASDQDLERYLRLMGEVPRVAAQLRRNLEIQRQKGILIPQPELPLVVGVMAAQAAPPERSPFAVAPARLEAFPAERAAAFGQEVARRIAAEVVPAFQAIVNLLGPEYAAEAPAEVGIGQYPGGPEAYAWLVRLHTTRDLSPEEIHRFGEAEMARIDARRAEVRARLGSDLDAAAFHDALRRDPRFLACSPEDVGRRLMAPIERIEPLVASWFGRTPKAPYGVDRVAPSLEAGMTFGYYDRPAPGQPVGRYLFNGSRLDERPLLNAASLIYHELVPGHHFQIALQNENEELPPIRQEMYPTAFVEGWAEYASGLAEEMGLYSEPYDLYGRLGMDAFLSSRLVVDTGMNALGWSRERALAWMAPRVLETETQLATETLRYAVDLPGQALAYKMGAAGFRELRRRAEEALGDRFDVRAFHDAVLGSGAMPLAVLDKHVDRWIAEQRAAQ